MTTLEFIPPVIAHRGASAYAPENTMAAFVKAAQLNIKWIEFDVMQAACGEPIIFHDERLDRTTDAQGEIHLFPYIYLQQLDAGRWFHPNFSGERILSLAHVLDFLSELKINANIEIKTLPQQEDILVESILKTVADFKKPLPTILYSSFSLTAIKCVNKLSPTSLVGRLLHEYEPGWEKSCEDASCVSVHVNEKIINTEAVKKIKSMNKKLLCYTVNKLTRAHELFNMGVDAIFSDNPDVILKK